MAFEQVGYQAGGRKIDLIEADDEGNPATAQAKYRKLVSQDRIHVPTGILLSNIGYGLVPPIERDRVPSLFLTTPDDLTKRRPAKYTLRTNFSASQPMHALGDYLMVSQFWTYKAEDFLKMPVYDRNYPPVRS